MASNPSKKTKREKYRNADIFYVKSTSCRCIKLNIGQIGFHKLKWKIMLWSTY